ncbi:sulfatase [candidate division KSB1 bacterium]|nr:MAG: sulfatase [candidate division KSB1 bacterium]
MITEGKDRKLNFIIINVDDLGWTDVTCYGSRYYETPNIDRLASQGMKFTNAYAACAVCSPTRAAIMTGRYPARIGVTDWIHHLDLEAKIAEGTRKNPVKYVGSRNKKLLCPPNPYWMELDEITIAEILKPAGYITCHIGKWHLGPRAWYPDKQGFDINIGGCEIGQPPTYFDPYYQNPRRSSIPTLPPRKQGEYLTDRESFEAVNFIKSHADKPFFLNMCHYAVHTPLQGKEKLVEKYKNKKKTNQKNPIYAAMIESVDQSVGKIMTVLDELNLSNRTIVIFTSDNGGLKGYSTDNAPLRSGKGYPYEGGIRVPLIIRWQGIVKAGSICDEPVISMDFFPTICEVAGLALPDDRVIDGESLVPLLKGSGKLKREAIFWHFPHYRGKDVVPYSIVRKGDWKLIKRYEGKKFELFNLKDDLSEKNDLSDKMPEKVRELDKILVKWLKETKAKLPKENPDYVKRR